VNDFFQENFTGQLVGLDGHRHVEDFGPTRILVKAHGTHFLDACLCRTLVFNFCPRAGRSNLATAHVVFISRRHGVETIVCNRWTIPKSTSRWTMKSL
jgi:hypothetical protein